MKVAVSVTRREYGSVILDVDDSIRDKAPRTRKELVQKMAQKKIIENPGCIKWSREKDDCEPNVSFDVSFGYMEIDTHVN